LEFANGTIDSIKSISQRALVGYWARLAMDGKIPCFDQFKPGSRVHDPKQLAVWKVEAHPGEIGFRSVHCGSLLDEAFDQRWSGRTLVDVTPPSMRKWIIEPSTHCVSIGHVIYTVLRTREGAGHSVDLERLLLPLGTNGRVTHLVASLQLISLKGDVNRRTIVGNFEAQTECVLSVRMSAASLTDVTRTVAGAR
jgi:hypothetical protein